MVMVMKVLAKIVRIVWEHGRYASDFENAYLLLLLQHVLAGCSNVVGKVPFIPFKAQDNLGVCQGDFLSVVLNRCPGRISPSCPVHSFPRHP